MMEFDLEATLKKQWEKDAPHFMLEVITNEEGKVEDYYIIESYEHGEYGRELKSNISDYIQADDLEDECHEPDTQYHVYGRIDWYKSGYYEVEWDCEFTITACIPLIKGFSKFCEGEADFEQQETWKSNDYNIRSLQFDGDDHGGSLISPNITYNDFVNLVKATAEYNIKLAHRLVSDTYHAKEILGDKYSEHIMELENKRMKFKNYIRHNQDYYVRFSGNGYQIRKQRKEGEFIDITFEQIDNITDELLQQYNPRDLFDLFYTSPAILKEFAKYDNRLKL